MTEAIMKKDPEITNQKFVLLSFLSPEKVNTSSQSQILNEIKNEKDPSKKCILYENLLNQKQDSRGIKIRGVFSKLEEAREYAQKLRENDEYFDIYVGSVGEWMPWDDSSKTEDNVYSNKQLD